MASAGPLAGVICVLGLVALVAWTTWRFGPTLIPVAGWACLSVAWASGSQGGCGYFAFFVVLGVLAWAGGTVWYARRRGRCPSPASACLFAHIPCGRGAAERGEGALRWRLTCRTR